VHFSRFVPSGTDDRDRKREQEYPREASDLSSGGFCDTTYLSGRSFGQLYDLLGESASLKGRRRLALGRGTSHRPACFAAAPVYGGPLATIPFGAGFAKGLTLKMGQTHVHKYIRQLLEKIQQRGVDPSFVITHWLSLNEAADGYELFRHNQDECIKVVLKP
jgi:threonine dehydrogenase-like Zn-dependent dehydrogenase